MFKIKQFASRLNKISKNIWLFPVVVILIYILFIATGVNGSSVGVYNDFINGGTSKDSNLLLGKPRSIRSDEFLVVTQILNGQEASGYPSINQNIGNGQDMNIMFDTPTRDWIQLFKPQNLAFYVMPFDNAFAYKWWFGTVVLLISAYFVALKFLRGKRLIASLMSISLYFTAFIQWWQSSALIAYSLLMCLLLIGLIETKSFRNKIILTGLIAYILVVFALGIYPPFQIPCILVVGLFTLGYMVSISKNYNPIPIIKQSLIYIICAGIVSISILFAYLNQHDTVVKTLQNTAYPGKRVLVSGKYSLTHLLSGQLAIQHEKISTSAQYVDHEAGVSNQSETSSFIFTSLYLLLPMAYLIAFSKKLGLIITKEIPILISLASVYVLFFAWLFVPGLDLIGSLTRLNMVSGNRLIIGFVILNYLTTIIFINIYSKSKKVIDAETSSIYSILVFMFVFWINTAIQYKMPGFIDTNMSLLLAIPIPVIIYLLLRKKTLHAVVGLLLFTLSGSLAVNPLYVGTGILKNNPIYQSISKYPDDGRWATEDLLFENFPLMANKHSLSGVYGYPQLELWQSIDQGKSIDKYNRYAHATFAFDKDSSRVIVTQFAETGADQLVVATEMCSDFMKQSKVRYVLSSSLYSASDQNCIERTETVKTPLKNYFIYSLKY